MTKESSSAVPPWAAERGGDKGGERGRGEREGDGEMGREREGERILSAIIQPTVGRETSLHRCSGCLPSALNIQTQRTAEGELQCKQGLCRAIR